MKNILKRIRNWCLVKRGKRHPQADMIIELAITHYTNPDRYEPEPFMAKMWRGD